ncbi:MAG: M20/M25/M40 family metallo-hydrolase [Nanoarchaeota archaeon]
MSQIDIVPLTKKLISFKSTSYHEYDLARFISQILNENHIPFVFDEFKPSDYSAPVSDGIKTANIYVSAGKGKETLLLYSHIDVVNAPESLFKPRIKENRLYGRGASDMKSAVAGLLAYLCDNYSKIKDNSKRIIFAFIADEETTATGIKRCVEWLKKQDVGELYCILHEPSNEFSSVEIGGRGYIFLDLQGSMQDIISCLNNIRLKKKDILAKYPDESDGFGSATLELTKINCSSINVNSDLLVVEGVACHASRPWQGENALEKALESYDDITAIITGDKTGPNTLPSFAYACRNKHEFDNSDATANIDIRTNIAASNNDDLFNEIKKLISKSIKWRLRDYGRAFKTGNKEFIDICRKNMDFNVHESIAQGGSDAPYLFELTKNVLPGFGPGNKSLSHKEEENIPLGVLKKIPRVIDTLVQNFNDMNNPPTISPEKIAS